MKVALYEPYLHGNEKRYVNECLDTTWISSKGKFVNEFEDAFAKYTNSAYAVAVSNGTVAIHLALAALDIKAGDEVIVPTFTYIASVNPIVYLGATPVFVDSDAQNWQIDIDDLERKITSKTKAVIAVHLYGGVADMPRIAEVCKKHNIYLVEDCAEAIGCRRNGQHVGTFGDIGCFSFFGNKTITTGEGGMVTAQDEALAKRLAHLKAQGVSPVKTYWHDAVAFNYRMTNIQAAIGLGQLEQIDEILARKRRIAELYKQEFAARKLPLSILWEEADCVNGFWLPTIALDDPARRDSLMKDLMAKYGVESRPTFYPAHTMPMYVDRAVDQYPVAEKLAAAGMNIPGHPGLKEADQMLVIEALTKELGM